MKILNKKHKRIGSCNREGEEKFQDKKERDTVIDRKRGEKQRETY